MSRGDERRRLTWRRGDGAGCGGLLFPHACGSIVWRFPYSRASRGARQILNLGGEWTRVDASGLWLIRSVPPPRSSVQSLCCGTRRGGPSSQAPGSDLLRCSHADGSWGSRLHPPATLVPSSSPLPTHPSDGEKHCSESPEHRFDRATHPAQSIALFRLVRCHLLCHSSPVTLHPIQLLPGESIHLKSSWLVLTKGIWAGSQAGIPLLVAISLRLCIVTRIPCSLHVSTTQLFRAGVL